MRRVRKEAGYQLHALLQVHLVYKHLEIKYTISIRESQQPDLTAYMSSKTLLYYCII